MATTLATQLVLDALNMALATRRPRGVIHHSDQGSQYTSIEFGHRCRAAGVRPSMGSVGDAVACPRAGEAGPGAHDSPHIQIVPKVSAKTGSSASIAANRSINGSSRISGMVGINS